MIGVVRSGTSWRRLLPTVALPAVLLVLAGCGGSEPVVTPSPSGTRALPESPAEQLLGRVAAAKDQRYTANYTFRVKGRPASTLSVTLARDGGWRFDVPGGAHAGARDVAYVGTRHGMFQCGLAGGSGCVKIAKPGGHVPKRYDPRVQHPFTDWLDVLSDSRAAISVDRDTSLSVPSGDCFSVEPNAASLTPKIDPGVYCFDASGVLTGARFSGITILIDGTAGKAPKSVELPGPVVAGSGLPTGSPTPTGSTGGSPGA